MEQALDLVAQDYTPAHVEKLTGWHARRLEAQLRRAAAVTRVPPNAAGRAVAK